ncbi:poxin-like isoform X2 [Maniola hyperantus]|uniref:poxin-like isoform X2 n=1 Tax=Aphantopus hyperantus TaxID=2795564 RepID=UPI00374818CA
MKLERFVIICFIVKMGTCTMSKRTVLNEEYKGLVEAFPIPAELHERDGKKFASMGSVLPIHCATPDQLAERSQTTHHYCDVFTDDLLAPLGELAYVRIDENVAEKVFLNRSKRILLISCDGKLAQWRCAPTFESANHYIAGAPIVNKDGALVSVVTARRGNHYAVSAFEGDGGYFVTTKSWDILDQEQGKFFYGDRNFSTREELKEYIKGLPPVKVTPEAPLKPVLLRGNIPRIALVTEDGTQLSHHYLCGVLTDIEYL